MVRAPHRVEGGSPGLANPHLVPSPRRLVILVAAVTAAVALGVPSALGHGSGGGLEGQKATIDGKISGLKANIEAAKAKEGVLTGEIGAQSKRIRLLEGDIRVLDAKVAKLEGELTARRAELAQLQELYVYETKRIALLTAQHGEAQRRLETRLVDLYETDQPDGLAILLQSGSLNDLIDQVQLLNEIGRQDQRIAQAIAQARRDMRVARARTARTKARVAAVTKDLAAKTGEERAARDAVAARRSELVQARAGRQSLLASVRDQKHADEENLDQMLAASAAIAAKIQAAQAAAAAAAAAAGQASGSPSAGSGAAPAGGFIWPVQGTITSGFGQRCLDGLCRAHEGIDIAAPEGTQIVAAAAGTIIFAGWMDGYGNLTLIDHGNGVATAYGHQSAIFVTSGAVSQGQAIGAVGSTGHSTGPHLHFEVRINGAPVDPLGYL